MKRILICPDSFKDYKSSIEICKILQHSISKESKDYLIKTLPLADGGEGTLAVLATLKNLQIEKVSVLDPLLRPIKAGLLIDREEKTAYVFMSEASGIELLSLSERNCYQTSSFGSGQLINHAIQEGCTHIKLFVGGSSTCDMGLGMAAALGAEFYNSHKQIEYPRGRDLIEIRKLKKNHRLSKLKFTVYTDVDNPLFGPNGSAFVYGPQKGASPDQVDLLDSGLRNIRNLIFQVDGMEVNISKAGAAGGMPAGAHYFLNADLKKSSEFLFDLANLKEEIKLADVVICGEGSLDQQTFSGKLVQSICQLAKDKTTIIVCGKNHLTSEESQKLFIDHIIALSELESAKGKSGIVDNLDCAGLKILACLT